MSARLWLFSFVTALLAAGFYSLMPHGAHAQAIAPSGSSAFSGNISVPTNSSVYLDGTTSTKGFSYDGTNINVVGGVSLNSTNGYGNNAGAASQGMQFSGSTTNINAGGASANIVLRNNGGGNYLAANPTLVALYTTADPVVAAHNANTAVAQAFERGASAATAGGVLAITFSTAFGAAPFCTCADTNAAPVACGISTAATTGGVTFTIGAARADTVAWQCVGNR